MCRTGPRITIGFVRANVYIEGWNVHLYGMSNRRNFSLSFRGRYETKGNEWKRNEKKCCTQNTPTANLTSKYKCKYLNNRLFFFAFCGVDLTVFLFFPFSISALGWKSTPIIGEIIKTTSGVANDLNLNSPSAVLTTATPFFLLLFYKKKGQVFRLSQLGLKEPLKI